MSMNNTTNNLSNGGNGSGVEDDPVVLIDRFVSASTVDDVVSSLRGIFLAVQQAQQQQQQQPKTTTSSTLTSELIHDDEFVNGLLQIIQTNRYKHLPVGDNPEVVPTVVRIYTELIIQDSKSNRSKNSARLLLEPSAGTLVETAIYIASGSSSGNNENNNTTSTAPTTYLRVLCLKLLRTICQYHSKVAQQQLINAPNGLHQLSNLLIPTSTDDIHNAIPEQVRDEAILLLTQIADPWSACAKILIFNDIADHLTMTIRNEGGLTNGSYLVYDCLQLLYHLLKHDTAVAELVFLQSPIFVQNITPLLDLRYGNAYRNPPSLEQQQQQQQNLSSKTPSKGATQPATSTNDDDLDDLLAMGKSKGKKQPEKNLDTEKENGGSKTSTLTKQGMVERYVPYLTVGEEKIINALFDILALALENEQIKKSMWQQHRQLVSLLWEMSLLAPPPPHVETYPCAVPSVSLQQRALQMVSQYLNHYDIMNQHQGLDRLLYMVCTGTGGGGNSNKGLQDRLLLQQSALNVIRRTLQTEMSNEMLMYTLNPMMMTLMVEEQQQNGAPAAPPSSPPPTVVRKLLNTAFENLLAITNTDHDDSNDKQETKHSLIQPRGTVSINRKIFLSGSLGGLSLFCNDEATRSILYRITTMEQPSDPAAEHKDGKNSVNSPVSLIDTILDCLMIQVDKLTSYVAKPADKEDILFVVLHLLRFLLEWMYEAPIVVQAILSSPNAATISTLYQYSVLSKNNNNNNNNGNEVTMSALMNCFLGLCMECIRTVQDDSKFGGWTVAGIMDMISSSASASKTNRSNRSGGVGLFTSTLEAMKTIDPQFVPWSKDPMEWKLWQDWYNNVVLVVRKRIVQELMGVGASSNMDQDAEECNDNEESDDNDVITGDNVGGDDITLMKRLVSPTKKNSQNKSLQSIVAQQSKEIEELRDLLSNATILTKSQEKQLLVWKQRVESSPTELDEMLTELTTKNAELDRKVMSLEDEMAVLKTKQEMELRERDERIESQRLELDETKVQEKEARDELDTLRDDLTSLSLTYSNLEGEYQRVQKELADVKASTTVPVTPPPETGVEPLSGNEQDVAGTSQEQQVHAHNDDSVQQPSSSLGSTEASTLRAENTRLQNNLKEADDWIAMAVDRMNEMQATITNLSSLEGDAQQSINSEREQRNHLEAVLMDTRNHYESELGAIKKLSEELQEKLDKSSNQEAVMTEQLDHATRERDNLQNQVNSLNEKLSDHQVELEKLKSLSTSMSHDDNTKEDEVVSLHSTVDSLRLELNIMRDEIDTAREHHEVKCKQYEATIANLKENIQPSDTSVMSNPENSLDLSHEVQTRDHEISELRLAYDEAQNWITQATQHHQMLNDALTRVSEENNHLQAMVSGSGTETLISDLNRMREVVETQEDELKSLRSIDLSGLPSVQAELTEAITRIKELQAQLLVKDSEIQVLQNIVQSQQKDSTIHETVESIQDLYIQIENRDKEIHALHGEIDTLKSQNVTNGLDISANMSSLADTIKTLEADLHVVTADKEKLQVELSEAIDNIEKMKVERDNIHETSFHSSELYHGTELANMQDIIKNLELQLTDQEEEHDSVIKEWEATYNAIEVEKNMIENALTEALEARKELESKLQEHLLTIDELSKERVEQSIKLDKSIGDAAESTFNNSHDSGIAQSPISNRIQKLEATIENLEEQLRDQEMQANETVEIWQQSYSDIEAKLKAALDQQQLIQSREADAEIEDASDSVKSITELQQSILDLQGEIERITFEANETVSAWQSSYNDLEQKLADVIQENDGLVEEMQRLSKHDYTELRGFQNKLNETLETNVNDYKSAAMEESRIDEDLSETVKDLERQITEVTKEAEDAVTLWQATCTELEAQITELQKDKDVLSEQLTQFSNAPLHSNEDKQNLSEVLANSVSLSEYNDLKQRLILITQEKESAIDEFRLVKEDYDRLLASQDELNTTSGDLNLYKSAVMDDSGTHEGNMADTVKNLEQQIAELTQEAEEVVLMWQATCSELESRVALLEDEKDLFTKKLHEVAAKEELPTGEKGSDNDVVNTTSNDIHDFESAVMDHSRNEEDLLDTVRTLESQIEELTQEAETAVGMWQANCTELELQIVSLENDKELLTRELVQATSAAGKMNADIDASNLRKGDEEHTHVVEGLNNQSDETKHDEAYYIDIIEQWQRSYATLESQLDALSTKHSHDSLSLKKILRRVYSPVLNDFLSLDAQQGSKLSLTLGSLSVEHDYNEFDDMNEIVDLLENRINMFEEHIQTIKEESFAVMKDLAESKTVLEATEYKIHEALGDDINNCLSVVAGLELILQRHKEQTEREKIRFDELEASTKLTMNNMETELKRVIEENENKIQQQQATIATLEESAAYIENQHQIGEQTSDSTNMQLPEKCKDLENRLEQAIEDRERLQIELMHVQSNQSAPRDVISTENLSGETYTNVVDSSDSGNARILELEEQKERDDEYYRTVISQWQSNYTALDAYSEEVTMENSRLTTELVLCKDSIKLLLSNDHDTAVTEDESIYGSDTMKSETENSDEVQTLIDRLRSRFEILSSQAATMREEIYHLSTELAATTKVQSDFAEAPVTTESQTIEFKNTSDTIVALQTELNALKDIHEQLKTESIKRLELEMQISELESLLAEQEAQAEDAVSQWKNSYEELALQNDQLNSLTDDLKIKLTELQSDSGTSDRVLEDDKHTAVLKGEAEYLEEEILRRKEELQHINSSISQDTNEKEKLQEKITVLESRVSVHMEASFRLEGEVEKMQIEIVGLKGERDDLLGTKRDLERVNAELMKEKENRIQMENQCHMLESRIVGIENNFIARLESLTSEHDRLVESLRNEIAYNQEAISKSADSLRAMTVEKTSLESENATLQKQASDLAYELKEANATMHMYVTNIATEKVSSSAADALHQELGEMCTHLENYKELLAEEHAQKTKLEIEVRKLKTDLATLVGMDNLTDNSSELQQKVIDAARKIQFKERSEIESLKEALARVKEELTIAQVSHHKTQEEASKANHQVIVYEQQVVASRDEFRYLTQAMDSMLESEATRRASFEYRISLLENELNMQRTCHSTELENLRNELNQVCMERDRFFQSLKESEKRRESLANVDASSPLDNAEVDCRKLKLEKAQLLLASNEEAIRMQRLLREARAAEKFSAETDILFERELRIAAENAIDRVNNELEVLKEEYEKISSKLQNEGHNSESGERLTELEKELSRAKDQLLIASRDNQSLRERLETTMKESQACIDRMQAETLQAKAKIIHFERSGHFEAEIRAEQTRLQQSSSWNGMNSLIVSTSDPAVDDIRDDVAVSKLYDFIKKQTRAIEEERTIYGELAMKNEELLALLAQLEILRESLNDAILEHGGQNVLEAAIRDAEERAQSEFGVVVRF